MHLLIVYGTGNGEPSRVTGPNLLSRTKDHGEPNQTELLISTIASAETSKGKYRAVPLPIMTTIHSHQVRTGPSDDYNHKDTNDAAVLQWDHGKIAQNKFLGIHYQAEDEEA